MTLKYRTIWISDVHLGTRGCKAEYLLDFLRHTECEQLYLVGDIIDFWKMKSGIYWPKLHSEVVNMILKKASHGTQVTYIPGNHDEIFRQYDGLSIQGITIQKNAIHNRLDGKRFLVLHGDEFDGIVCNKKWLAYFGSEVYDILLVLNHWFNYFRRTFGFPYWSLSAYLKKRVKNAVNFIGNFEDVLINEGLKRGVDGIVCGHIHHAAISKFGESLTYYNCGDWVESCTGLVENRNGQISIVRWVEDSVHLLNEEVISENRTNKRRLASTD